MWCLSQHGYNTASSGQWGQQWTVPQLSLNADPRQFFGGGGSHFPSKDRTISSANFSILSADTV